MAKTPRERGERKRLDFGTLAVPGGSGGGSPGGGNGGGGMGRAAPKGLGMELGGELVS